MVVEEFWESEASGIGACYLAGCVVEEASHDVNACVCGSNLCIDEKLSSWCSLQSEYCAQNLLLI